MRAAATAEVHSAGPHVHPGRALFAVVTWLFGVTSLGLFYFFLWHGPLGWFDLRVGISSGLSLNAALALGFFVQHSLMIRRGFRRWLADHVEDSWHSAIYTIASAVVLMLSVAFWQATPAWLELEGMVRLAMRAVFVVYFVAFAWTAHSLKGFDAFGIEPLLHPEQQKQSEKPELIVRGSYRWVRHPLYFFSIVLFWVTPDYSAGRLLFNILWTAWIIIGAHLEERDLLQQFGEAYREYQQRVPMLWPRFKASGDL